MKKSTIVVGIGIFIIVTTLLCINTDDKLYQKQKHFQTSSEVIQQLKNNPVILFYENGERKETNQFKECLSKRKRLIGSQLYFDRISIEKIEELDEEEKVKLSNEYTKRKNNLSKKVELKEIEPVRLQIKTNDRHYGYKNEEEQKDNEREYKLDLVLVDEGEGLVIDYVNYQSKEDYERGSLHDQG